MRHLLLVCVLVCTFVWQPSLSGEQPATPAATPGVDFPIPLAGRYRELLNLIISNTGKLVIGELFVAGEDKQWLYLTEGFGSLSRFKARRNKTVNSANFLPGDWVLLRAKIAGETRDKRLAGYPERYIVLEPVLAFGLHPRSLEDALGQTILVPESGPIEEERAFRNVLRDASAYRGREVAWRVIVDQVHGGHVYVRGPPMSGIRAMIQLQGTLRKLRPARNDTLTIRAPVVGTTRTKRFGAIDELVLLLGSPKSVMIERAEDLL